MREALRERKELHPDAARGADDGRKDGQCNLSPVVVLSEGVLLEDALHQLADAEEDGVHADAKQQRGPRRKSLNAEIHRSPLPLQHAYLLNGRAQETVIADQVCACITPVRYTNPYINVGC